jgi:dihydrofolate reductase
VMGGSRQTPALSVIVAADRGGLIGSRGGLPWRVPEDLRRFRRLTMGHFLIMGRRTYEGLPRVLDGRRIVVMTRNTGFRPGPGASVAHTVEEALSMVAGEEAFVGGGAQVYATLLPLASRLYLTLVEGHFDGDAYLPAVDWDEWRLAEEEPFPGPPAFVFRRYDRLAGARA